MTRTVDPAAARQSILGAITAVVIAVVIAASTAACTRDEGLSGMGLPQLSADDEVAAEPVPFEGVLRIGPQGCLMVRLTDPAGDAADRWTVWPAGAEQVLSATGSGNGARVDGEVYADQETISGRGRLVRLADLPLGSSPGSYFEGSGRYCDALVGGVLVIDDVQHA